MQDLHKKIKRLKSQNYPLGVQLCISFCCCPCFVIYYVFHCMWKFAIKPYLKMLDKAFETLCLNFCDNMSKICTFLEKYLMACVNKIENCFSFFWEYLKKCGNFIWKGIEFVFKSIFKLIRFVLCDMIGGTLKFLFEKVIKPFFILLYKIFTNLFHYIGLVFKGIFKSITFILSSSFGLDF